MEKKRVIAIRPTVAVLPSLLLQFFNNFFIFFVVVVVVVLFCMSQMVAVKGNEFTSIKEMKNKFDALPVVAVPVGSEVIQMAAKVCT